MAARRASSSFRAAVHELVSEAGGHSFDDEVDPKITPPIYGRWHHGIDAIEAGTTPWIRELNEEPTFRIAGAIGTRVVQQQQESLMAAACRAVSRSSFRRWAMADSLIGPRWLISLLIRPSIM